MTVAAKPAPAPELPEEPYNAGNAKHVAEATKAANARLALLRAGLRHILTNEAGRAYIHHILEQCGVFQSSFTGNSETFMREGQRNIGLILMADIHRDHEELYITMCREARARGSRGFRPKALKDKDRAGEEGEG